MGMSASQARLLNLQARQSNLEYQGQQINQERTILSQQCTALYNSLLAMTVPTPPSTSDYTTIKYSGTIGATNYSFDASSIKPGKDNSYTLTVNQEAYGNSLQKNPSIAAVDTTIGGTEKVEYVSNKVEKETTTKLNTYTAAENTTTYMVPYTLSDNDKPENYYVFENNKYRKGTQADKDNNQSFYKLTTSGTKPENGTGVKQDEATTKAGDPRKISSAELAELYYLDNGVLKKATTADVDGTGEPYTLKTDYKYCKLSSSGSDAFPVEGAIDNVSVNGRAVFDLNTYTGISDEQRAAYEAAIKNSGLTKPNGDSYNASDFYIYFNTDGEANFVLKSDVHDGNNNATTYSYIANGKYSRPTTYNDVQLTFDPSSGRITEIALPNYATEKDAEGNTIFNYEQIDSYTSIKVSAEKVTDEAAYNDAYAKYEYAQYEYDKKQQEINAKTEIIQQEDRNLELKLQRLDNERTQITTEIEAVDKVINDNIEASYKTFSG